MIRTGKSAARSTYEFDFLGAQTLKNIAEPMRAWRIQIGADVVATAKPPFRLSIQLRFWRCPTSLRSPYCHSRT